MADKLIITFPKPLEFYKTADDYGPGYDEDGKWHSFMLHGSTYTLYSKDSAVTLSQEQMNILLKLSAEQQKSLSSQEPKKSK